MRVMARCDEQTCDRELVALNTAKAEETTEQQLRQAETEETVEEVTLS